MGSGTMSRPAAAREDDALRESVGLNKSSMASNKISEMFKMAGIGTGIKSDLLNHESGNTSDGCDDDGFQSIMIAAVSNDTIKHLLRAELQDGAFSRYIKRHHYPGPALEFLNHVVNIEKFKRATCEATTMHREFVRMRSFYHSRAAEKMVHFPNHASVHILKTLEYTGDVDLAETEDLKVILFRSQEEIIGLLAPIIAEFIFTPYCSQMKSPSQRKKFDQQRKSEHTSPKESQTSSPVGQMNNNSNSHYRRNKKQGSSGGGGGSGGGGREPTTKTTSSNPYTAALEASVANVLRARFREAQMAPFELEDILSPAISTNGGGRSTRVSVARQQSSISIGAPSQGAS